MWPPELPVVLRDGVTLRMRRAGLASRALAWALDASLLVVCMELVATLLGGLSRLSTPLERALLVAFGFTLHWAYGALAEWRWGSTIGKRLLGLGVVDAAGGRPSLRRTLARNLMRILDVLPGLWLVGGVSAWTSASGRRVGDRAARTVVVCLAPPATRLHEAENTRNHAEAVARPSGPQGAGLLGARLSGAERQALRDLCAARDQLPLGTRDALFEQLGRHFGQRVGLERPPHRTWESVLFDWQALLRAQGELG